MPAQKLLDAFFKPGGGFNFGPDIDGYFLRESLPAIFAAGKQNDVPLLAGWNRDEGSFAMAAAPEKTSVDSMKAAAQKEFGAHAADFLRLYSADTDAEAERSMEDFVGDRFIAWSAWRWMEAQARTGRQPIYRYRFDLAPPGDPKGPQLGGIPFVGNRVRLWPARFQSSRGLEIGGPAAQRTDAGVLGKFCAQRRSERPRLAEVALVFLSHRMAGDVFGRAAGSAQR